jgi:hypothetical protein
MSLVLDTCLCSWRNQQDMLNMFSALSALEDLHISSSSWLSDIDNPWITDTDGITIKLPRMKRLSLASPVQEVVSFLASVAIPVRATLLLACEVKKKIEDAHMLAPTIKRHFAYARAVGEAFARAGLDHNSNEYSIVCATSHDAPSTFSPDTTPALRIHFAGNLAYALEAVFEAVYETIPSC